MNREEFLSKLTYDLNDDLKREVVDNMVKFGGSFVKALADCAIKADYRNFTKLVNAFEDYFWNYSPEKWEDKNEN